MPKPLYDRGRVAGPKSHDPAENEKQTKKKKKEKMQGTSIDSMPIEHEKAMADDEPYR